MRAFVTQAIRNAPAMNTLMVGILVVGTVSLFMMRREMFPEFDLEIVLVSVPYPGASPEEVEEGICQKIEEAVRSVDGIKKVTSVAGESSGSVVLELRADVKDPQKVVTEVRSEVDRIPSFPELAEDAEVQQITMRETAITVGVLAPPGNKSHDEIELRSVAEFVRDELQRLNSISKVDLQGARDYQIDVEISEDTLRKHGLSLQSVADTIRQENLEVPGGTMRSEGQEVLLRGKNKRLLGAGISKLPLVTDPNGVVLTVGDLGTVRDEFADVTAISKVNGRHALALSVERTTTEDLLRLTNEVREYVSNADLPGGYELTYWGDRSVDVADRLDMLVRNGRMGLILVFLVLAIFLELRLAFWVALGIPVSLLGAGGLLLAGGQTLNMLSMFAFLMALGIVVDDAIVVGENVFAHRQMNKSFRQAAIDGTMEVLPSVFASIATTIIAFCPLLFVTGIMGKFIAVMPFAVIAMLLISLFESTFILPCHLAHSDSLVFRLAGIILYPFRFVVTFFARVNAYSHQVLTSFLHRLYLPCLRWSLENPVTVVSASAATLIVAIGFVRSGIVPFIVFPKIDSNYLQASVTFPNGTPAMVTDQATRKIEQAIERLNVRADNPLTRVVFRNVGQTRNNGNPGGGSTLGSHVGYLSVQLVDTTERDLTSEQITQMWREEIEEIPGIESLSIGTQHFGPAGTPIEFKLLADGTDVGQLEAAVERCKAKLATYPGVFDIADDSHPGKWEMQVRIKERARSMGVHTAELADTIRASYYGAEVMRLQRGRHEVKLMVRYPPKERQSLAGFEDIRVRTDDGQERPVTEVAHVDIVRGYSEINRVDQMRSITVKADLDENTANAREIVSDLEQNYLPGLLAEFPSVKIRWEGQQEQMQESLTSLMIGTLVALVVMFGLLTLEFKSYLQPLLIMIVIPFGIIGAIAGHALMGLPLTLFSFFGLVALTGVVVNDSIVLIDFINRQVRKGKPIREALLESGQRRFRPVMLTSATTIAGLLPILIESSFQAQLLIPMATSLSFGLLVATGLVLLLVPTFYRIYFALVPYQAEDNEFVGESDFARNAQPAA